MKWSVVPDASLVHKYILKEFSGRLAGYVKSEGLRVKDKLAVGSSTIYRRFQKSTTPKLVRVVAFIVGRDCVFWDKPPRPKHPTVARRPEAQEKNSGRKHR